MAIVSRNVGKVVDRHGENRSRTFQICTLYIHYRFNNVMKHIYMRTPVGEWGIDL
jgi:hypothetical protein